MTLPDQRPDAWQRLADHQDGVIARWQLRSAGASDSEIRRLLRRRILARLHQGVYITHTGHPTWEQRAWAAVLACWPAALAGRSALRPPDAAGQVMVVVERGRNVTAPHGVVVRHHTNHQFELMPNAHPPRQRTAFAALDAIEPLTEATAYALLADLVQRSHTTPTALREAMSKRSRVRRRKLLETLIADLETGAGSVLERTYLHRVERAHGLPRGERQIRDDAGGIRVQRDVLYASYRLIVELDGTAFHNAASARDRDAARDLAAAVVRSLTSVRLTTGQVLNSPCSTAVAIGTLLQRGGWRGRPSRCPECATVRLDATG